MTNQQPIDKASRLAFQDSMDITNLFASSDSMHAAAKEVFVSEFSFVDPHGSEDHTVAVSSSSSDWSSEENGDDQELGDFLWEALASSCDSEFTTDEIIDLCPA